jgi:hypothetical protein
VISKEILQSIYRDPFEWISALVFFIIGLVAAWLKGEVGSIIFVVMLVAHVIVISDIILWIFRRDRLTVRWALLAFVTFSYSAGLWIVGSDKTLLAFNLLGGGLSVFIVVIFYLLRK